MFGSDEIKKALGALDETQILMKNMNTSLLQIMVLLSEQNELLREVVEARR